MATQLDHLLAAGRRSRSPLRELESLERAGEYRGLLRVGGRKAEVILEPDGILRVTMPLEEAPEARVALARQSDLAASVRFGGGTHPRVLLGDTRLDGRDHLPASLVEIRAAFAAVLEQRRPAPAPSADLRPRLEAALARLGGRAGALVHRGAEMELRPRIEGGAVALQVHLEEGGLRLSRTLLEALPLDPAGAAIAEQCLRLNARLNHARLSLNGAALCAEARLRADLVRPDWLAPCALAVASAARLAQPLIDVLCEHEGVARCCVQLFSPGPEPKVTR